MTDPSEEDLLHEVQELNEQIQELQSSLMQTQKLSSVGAGVFDDSRVQ